MRRYVEVFLGRIPSKGSVDVWDIWLFFPENVRRGLAELGVSSFAVRPTLIGLIAQRRNMAAI
jgi:hypothetical protein